MVFALGSKVTTDVVVNDGKPIIFERYDKTELDSKMDVTKAAKTRSSATFEHDGDVHYDQSKNLYYMKGWSTAEGSTGVDLYHYTTVDFANFLGLNSFGAVTKWGTGKVWATSKSVGWEVYDSTYGRIRYGL